MKKLIRSLVLVCFTIGVLIVASYAWFTNSELIEPDLSGYSVAAYFGGGDGSQEKPFEIKNRRHLYNLAWLQFLGYFNKPGVNNIKDEENTTSYTQFSFVIDNDIDMEHWVLPPIGTTEYPFIGKLNGQGHTISNLTVSNDFSEISATGRYPGSVNADGTNDKKAFGNAEIIGFVGSIGDLNNMYGAKVSSTKNSLTNVKLEEITVHTNTPQTLCGIVAGYINATVSNVGIIKSKLNVGTATALANQDAVSNYTVAGYATDDYVTKVSNNKTVVMNPTVTNTVRYTYADEGDTTGWGGSIDMKSAFNRLSTIATNYAQSGTSNFYLQYDVYPDYQGDKYHVANRNITLNPPSNYTETYYVYNSSYHGSSYKEEIGSFNFNKRTSTSSTNYSSYIYLNGGHYDIFHSAYVISCDSNYLKVIKINDNYVIQNTDTYSEASVFYYDNNTFYCYINGNKYYLRNYNNNLELSTTLTSWTVQELTNGYIISNNGYYILCENNEWKLKEIGFNFYNGSNYLSYNSNNQIVNGNSETAKVWHYDSNGRIYTYINDTKYYISATTSTISLSSNLNDARKWTVSTSSSYFRFYFTSGNKTYYFKYNNGWKVETGNTGRNVYYTNSYDEEIVFYNYSISNVEKSFDYSWNDSTYFPLNVESDFTPKDINTGYIVGGTRLDSNKTYASAYGSIRVSIYGQKNGSYYNLGNYNYSSYKFNTNSVYTINSNNQIVTINDSNNTFKKYADTKSKVEDIIKSDVSKIYGLHFMDDPVSINNLVTASYVLIDKTEYHNYQLPVSTIDFNLHSKGYVNFFAGTYGAANNKGDNAFFSVHQVFRDSSNNIIYIKEIEAIYSNGEDDTAYIYKYKDGTYSASYTLDAQGNRNYSNGDDKNTFKTSIPSEFTEIFNTSCLAANVNIVSYRRKAFYFEIPMNDGEFVLGSVTDDPGNLGDTISGAYLMYLDISANAQQVDRTEIQQKTTVTKYDYVYPNGIAVIYDTNSSINAASSAVVKITSVGIIQLERISATRIDATGTLPNSVALVSNYIPRNFVLNDVSSAMTATAIKTTSSIYSQIQYIDYNISKKRTFETNIISEVESVDDDITASMIKLRIDEITSTRTHIFDSTDSSIGGTDPTAQTLDWKLTGLVSDGAGGQKNLSFKIVDNSSNQPQFAGEASSIKTTRQGLFTALTDALETIAEIVPNSTHYSILEYDYDTAAEKNGDQPPATISNTYDALITSTKDTSNTTGTYYKATGDNITVTTNNTGGTKIYVTVANTTYVFTINGNTADATTNNEITVSQS